MAAASGRDRAPVSEQLLNQAYRFDFFQAVRLLDRLAREDGKTDGPRRAAVGQDSLPSQEIVRFRASPSLSFPTGTINELCRSAKAAAGEQRFPPEMVVSFLGLTGPSGVLPHHYTALVIERCRDKDYSLRDFLDLFNHRAISLFYRAWEKYRFPFAYERSELDAPGRSEDLFTWCLYCLVGFGTRGLRGRLTFDDEAFLFYAGHFAHHPRSALGLEQVLADYFELTVNVKQFQGQWLALNEEDKCMLPAGSFGPLGKRLGADAVVGDRVWDIESRFRVRLGPLSYREFRDFMPSGRGLKPLCQMIRTYAGPQFDFDVQPVLRAEEVPWCKLGADGGDPARLGWNTWIRSGPSHRDADDAIFSLEA